MKTFIIQLESHDDLDSARDKLKGTKARRVVFVWPKTDKALTDFYSLSLLQREAERQGVAISFISSHAEVRENAKLMGIPVFHSLSQAERSSWKSPKHKHIDRRAPLGYQYLIDERERLHPKKNSSHLYEFGQITLFLVSLFSLLGLILFFVPSALVRIAPQKEVQTIPLDVRVNPSINEISLAGILPGQVVTLELSGSRTAASSGQSKVGVNSATGVLLVVNQSGLPLDLPKGTPFITRSGAGLTFETQEDTHLVADSTQAVAVKVIAMQAGTEGNLPAGESFITQAVWAGSVTASNAEAFSGGTSIDSPSPTAEDYAKARQVLMEDLKQQAGKTLLVGRPEGTVLIPQSLGGTVLSEVRSAEPGLPADHFTIEIKMSFAATTYLQSDLDELAQSILNANIQSGMKPVCRSLQITPLMDYSLQDGNIIWKVSASQVIEKQVNLDELSQSLVRMPVSQALAYLDSHLTLEKSSEVLVSPRWWKNMPFAYFRIIIEEQ